jgi:hypothetical protein
LKLLALEVPGVKYFSISIVANRRLFALYSY